MCFCEREDAGGKVHKRVGTGKAVTAGMVITCSLEVPELGAKIEGKDKRKR